MDNKWKIIIGVTAAVFILLFVVASYQSQGPIDTKEWSRITSPDGRLSVDLPRNPVLEVDDSPDKVEGFSYTAFDQGDKVVYIVKYENYGPVAAQTNVDLKNADEPAIRIFLRGLVDLTVEEFSLSNFTSEFTTSHGYSAVRFSGEISQRSQGSINVEGIIILVDEAAYSVITLYDLGYTADLKRALDSLTFNY